MTTLNNMILVKRVVCCKIQFDIINPIHLLLNCLYWAFGILFLLVNRKSLLLQLIKRNFNKNTNKKQNAIACLKHSMNFSKLNNFKKFSVI